MANIFDNVAKSDIEVEVEVLRGGSKKVTESGAYLAEITMARDTQKAGAARWINLDFELEDGRSISHRWWYANKDDNMTYVNKEGKELNYGGANEIFRFSELLTGDKYGFGEVEDKIVPVYDFNARAEVDTPSKVMTNIIGKPVMILIRKTLEDKNDKDYNPTTEVRSFMDFVGFVDAVDSKTAAEKKAGKDAGFYAKFLEAVAKDPIVDNRDLSAGTDVNAPAEKKEPSEEAKNAFN